MLRITTRSLLLFSFIPVFFLVLFMGSSGCTKKTDGQNSGEKVVNVAVWAAYLSETSIQEFQSKTGIRVIVSNYASNEELLAKLQAGASGYDVIFPSDYMVSVMTKLALLTELDHKKIPVIKDLSQERFGLKYDPQNKFSLPYAWGTTGIAIHRGKYKGKIESWADVFSKEDLKGKFTLLDDVRETMGAALLRNGHSINTRNPAELEKAKETLNAIKPRIQAFVSDSKPLLISGQVAVAHGYSSDALQASNETHGKIEYIIPKEGCTLWLDNLAIVKGSPNVDQAYALIEYLLGVENGVRIATETHIAPTNTHAIAKLPKEVGPGSPVMPSPDKLKKCQMLEDIGDDIKAWDEAWTQVKAS